MIRFEIHGDNPTITDAIRNYIEEKTGRLERYFNNVSNAVAHVKVKTYQNSATKIGVTIPLKSVMLRAEERHDDLYTGIDLAASRLERQVCKYKTRANRRNRDNGEPGPFIAEQQAVVNEDAEATSESSNENEIEIIRSKQFSLKSMGSEEAVLQMDLLGYDFYIFTDHETDGTSIVYRREDGKYGLIETTR